MNLLPQKGLKSPHPVLDPDFQIPEFPRIFPTSRSIRTQYKPLTNWSSSFNHCSVTVHNPLPCLMCFSLCKHSCILDIQIFSGYFLPGKGSFHSSMDEMKVLFLQFLSSNGLLQKSWFQLLDLGLIRATMYYLRQTQ